MIKFMNLRFHGITMTRHKITTSSFKKFKKVTIIPKNYQIEIKKIPKNETKNAIQKTTVYCFKVRHLGDNWARLNFNILNVKSNVIIKMKKNNEINYYENLLSLLDLSEWPWSIRIAKWNENIQINKKTIDNTSVYKKKYFPTKIKWSKDKMTNTIGYSFEANFLKHEKIPPWLNILILKTLFPNLVFIKLGLPMSLSTIITILSSCKCYIGIDNGITHVARSVGCPIGIIEHIYNVEIGHPSDIVSYKKLKSLMAVAEFLKS